MNNRKIRPIMSVIELRMILQDMDKAEYQYSGENFKSHLELKRRLQRFNK
jgi:hypothetical protein